MLYLSFLKGNEVKFFLKAKGLLFEIYLSKTK